MRRASSGAAWALALLAGCVTTGQYDKGRAVARREIEHARKEFGPAGDEVLARSLLSPEHHRRRESPEWRKGFEDAVREELAKGQPPPEGGRGSD